MRSRLLDRYLEPLLQGNRGACRELIRTAIESETPGHKLYEDVLWPAMERVEKLYRSDEISMVTEHMATRINRALADQIQQSLPSASPKGRRILIMCAPGESEELGAQMCADLFESDGWGVYFVGGGVPNDEVLSLVGQLRPDVLLVFGTEPHGVPQIREMIDLIRDVGSHPTMNIMVSGGVYTRADGLWSEINADLYAPTAKKAIKVANEAKPRIPEVRIPGAPKKRRRRRRSPVLAAAES